MRAQRLHVSVESDNCPLVLLDLWKNKAHQMHHHLLSATLYYLGIIPHSIVNMSYCGSQRDYSIYSSLNSTRYHRDLAGGDTHRTMRPPRHHQSQPHNTSQCYHGNGPVHACVRQGDRDSHSRSARDTALTLRCRCDSSPLTTGMSPASPPLSHHCRSSPSALTHTHSYSHIFVSLSLNRHLLVSLSGTFSEHFALTVVCVGSSIE